MLGASVQRLKVKNSPVVSMESPWGPRWELPMGGTLRGCSTAQSRTLKWFQETGMSLNRTGFSGEQTSLLGTSASSWALQLKTAARGRMEEPL